MSESLPHFTERVRLVALSSPAYTTDERAARIRAGVARMEALGFRPKLVGNAHAADAWRAGPARLRARNLVNALATPGCDMVQALRGGASALTVLEHIDWQAIADCERPFLGYSDATAVLNMLAARTRVSALHGPVTGDMADASPATLASLRAALDGRPWTIADLAWVTSGQAEGRLVGGNLTCLASMIGTSCEPDWRGKIVFAEEVFEDGSRIERCLTQMRLAGVFRRAAGLVFGRTTQCSFSYDGSSTTLETLLLEATAGTNIPVATSQFFGHRPGDMIVLPLGKDARLDERGLSVGLNGKRGA